MNPFWDYLDGFVGLIYPDLCVACDTRLVLQEKYICMNCLKDIPLTNFQNAKGNKIEQLFWGRIEVERATAYFSYKKGSRYQKVIHDIKYRGMKELGFEMGRRFGFILNESPDFKTIDCIVPVPLHPKKQKLRGYNQSYWIATGMGQSMDKPVISENLHRKIYTVTQTRKSKFERWQNVEGIFGVADPLEFFQKHVLLVDDVVTTGSTLEACIFALQQVEAKSVSIATLAYADS